MSSGPLIDTHCHLVLLEERGLLDEALAGARSAGVEQIVSVGLNLEDSDRNRAMAERCSGVFFTVGWHPHEPASPTASDLAALEDLLQHPRAVAVGEIGLDQYWRPGYHEVPLAIQMRSFELMVELALRHRKPVIVHDRDSHAEVLAGLDAFPGVRALFHCFSGDAALAAACRQRDHVLSFAGTLTFPRSEGIQAAAAQVDDEGYVVETDSPFLAPVPHRGRPNQPGFVAATAAAVARCRGTDEMTVRRQTTANARAFLGLPDDDRIA